MTHFVYMLTNNMNDKKYVGVSRSPAERLRTGHLYARSAIGAAIRKHGIENFTLTVLLSGSADYCYMMEDPVIEAFQSRHDQQGYNILRGGLKPGGQTGSKRSDETKAKMREAQLGKRHSEETRGRISLSKKGTIQSAEVRARQGEARRGKPRPQEVREKISSAQIGKIVSDETRARQRDAHLGRTASEETKARMRAAHAARRGAAT